MEQHTKINAYFAQLFGQVPPEAPQFAGGRRLVLDNSLIASARA
jgi:hypothetical protein